MDEVFQRIYYNLDHPDSFSSVEKLYLAAKQIDNKITLNDTKNWLSKQRTYTIHRNVIRKFKRNRVIVQFIDEQWQADLVDMQQHERQNLGYKYLITIIDIFSKYAWVIPLKNKTAKNVFDVLNGLFEERQPFKFQTDQGKEFDNGLLRKLFKDRDINFFTTKNRDIKCCVVERFNRTLRSKMFKYFSKNKTHKYIDILHKLVDGYNNTYHSSIKMKPTEVNETNQDLVFKNLYKVNSFRDILKNKIRKKGVQKDDLVRIPLEKKTFNRGYDPNWTDHSYKVEKIIPGSRKTLYKLVDNENNSFEKRFYPEEVQKISNESFKIEKIIKRKTINGIKKVFVKWVDYPAESNSWILESDLNYYNFN